MTHYVIIGGDAAGMSAAMKIRRAQPEAQITAYEKGSTFSYAQCGLPYFIAGQISDAKKLIARRASTFQEKYHIDAKNFHEVTTIDARNQKVQVHNLNNKSVETVPYDKLLIAAGGSPIVPDWEGVHLKGVFSLKTIEDAEQILHYAKTQSVRKVTIIGGGYIGLEMAESFVQLDKEVTVIDRGKRLIKTFDEEGSTAAQKALEKYHVQVLLNEEVQGLSGSAGTVKQVQTTRLTMQSDLVLIAIGITPNSKLAIDAGIRLGEKKAIEVDPLLQTSHPHIFAAGDCATQYHRLKERSVYVPLGTHANKQGRLAGANMMGEQQAFGGIVGTSILKVLDLEMGRTGLSEAEAQEMDRSIDSVLIDSTDHAAYYPDAKKQTIKLIYDAHSKQLLGGQAFGHGVNKTIDTLATALYSRLTLSQLEELDLAYAPPFSSVWAPVQQAARRGN